MSNLLEQQRRQRQRLEKLKEDIGVGKEVLCYLDGLLDKNSKRFKNKADLKYVEYCMEKGRTVKNYDQSNLNKIRDRYLTIQFIYRWLRLALKQASYEDILYSKEFEKYSEWEQSFRNGNSYQDFQKLFKFIASDEEELGENATLDQAITWIRRKEEEAEAKLNTLLDTDQADASKAYRFWLFIDKKALSLEIARVNLELVKGGDPYQLAQGYNQFTSELISKEKRAENKKTIENLFNQIRADSSLVKPSIFRGGRSFSNDAWAKDYIDQRKDAVEQLKNYGFSNAEKILYQVITQRPRADDGKLSIFVQLKNKKQPLRPYVIEFNFSSAATSGYKPKSPHDDCQQSEDKKVLKREHSNDSVSTRASITDENSNANAFSCSTLFAGLSALCFRDIFCPTA